MGVRAGETVGMAYGDGRVRLRIPEGRCRTVKVDAPDGGRKPAEAFEDALDRPLAGPRLEERVRGKDVLYLVEDATRSAPHEAFAAACMPRLAGARRVHAVVATGSHEVDSPGNLRIVQGLRTTAQTHNVPAEVTIHDCSEVAALVTLGSTARGTPVTVRRAATECDLLLVNSEMKNHYFAGYSNAVKCLLPGICAHDAIEANHALALEPESTFGRHPLHPDPDRRTNPVAEDMWEAARMILEDRAMFVLASVTAGGRSVWAGAGEVEAVLPEGMRQVDRVAGARVPVASRVIVSPGGAPCDETLYNAQRGLELARNAMAEGAEVLFLAACPRGVAPTADARKNFYDRLCRPLEEVLRSLEERYVLYSHKAYKFARMLRDLSALHVHTELDEATVSAAHMRKVESPQAVVDRWLREGEEPILAVADANRLALYPER